MAIIGIDLGTTNSAVSYYSDGECKLIPNALGQLLTPSVITVLEDNRIAVGAIAKERLITHPDKTVSSFKRFMGSSKTYDLGLELEHTKITPTVLSSFILKALKADAENYLNEPIDEAIVSTPAYFNDSQRRETKEAAKLAGLHVDRIINEPTAAAVAYGLNKRSDESSFLVFDLGGGTFDVSILEMFDGIMEVHAIAGDNFLGGDDFDKVLMDRFASSIGIDINIEKTITSKELKALKKEAERCKIELNTSEKTQLSCFIGGAKHSLEITYDEFEFLCQDLLLNIRTPIKKALSDSKIKLNQLEDIVLVGGSSKMRIIKNFVTKIFGKFPLTGIDPDKVVSIGAGVCAAMKARNDDFKEIVLTDVCPFTLGIDSAIQSSNGTFVFNQFSPMIERNTVLPCSKTNTFYTIQDNQDRIEIPIYQGEQRLADKNLYLGKLEMAVPKKPRGEAAIDVRFTYDINGILEVEVKSVDTGEQKNKIIINSHNSMTEKEISQRLEELAELKIHPRDKEKNKFLVSLAERLFEESLGFQREKIAFELSNFEAIMSSGTTYEVEKAAIKFEKFLDSLSDSKQY